MSVTTETRGLEDAARLVELFPEATRSAATMAVNQVAKRDAIRLAREPIYEQVSFPPGYLTKERLGVTKTATTRDIEAVVTGRDRPTSLARFVISGVYGRQGVTVKVGQQATSLRRAFLVRLRNGNAGLALRLKEGEEVVGKHSEHKQWLVKGKVALLYGPSVDQVFRGVASEITDHVGDALVIEFNRQVERLL